MQDILEKPLNFMHCVVSRFGYPNYRLSELSMVPISSDNRRSAVFHFLIYYKFRCLKSHSLQLTCAAEFKHFKSSARTVPYTV